MRLPDVQDLNEVVGNGLRSSDFDTSSSVVGTGSDLIPSRDFFNRDHVGEFHGVQPCWYLAISWIDRAGNFVWGGYSISYR